MSAVLMAETSGRRSIVTMPDLAGHAERHGNTEDRRKLVFLRYACCNNEIYYMVIYMKEVFFLVEEADEGGYCARAIGESIFTQADTIEELKHNIRDCISCHFDKEKPAVIRLHFVHDEIMTYA